MSMVSLYALSFLLMIIIFILMGKTKLNLPGCSPLIAPFVPLILTFLFGVVLSFSKDYKVLETHALSHVLVEDGRIIVEYYPDGNSSEKTSRAFNLDEVKISDKNELIISCKKLGVFFDNDSKKYTLFLKEDYYDQISDYLYEEEFPEYFSFY